MLPFQTHNRTTQEVTEMGLSLADAAVRGTMSPRTIARRKQSLLEEGDIEGLLALNHSIFGVATMMADGDGDDDSDEDSGEDDDGDGDDEDDDEDEDEGDQPDAKDERIRELSAEAKKKRVRIREQKKRIEELEAENARLKKGSKSKAKADEDGDEPDSDEDAEALKQDNQKLSRANEDLLIRLEFTDLVTGEKAKHRPKNIKAALRLLDLSDVEITEDGEVEGLEEALEDLAKSDPYLFITDEDEDDDDEDDLKKRRRKKTGQPTGSRKKAQPNRDKLVAKYPALRR